MTTGDWIMILIGIAWTFFFFGCVVAWRVINPEVKYWMDSSRYWREEYKKERDRNMGP